MPKCARHSSTTYYTWFENLAMMILDESGCEFRDAESVRADYDAGKNLADVAKEIAAEYN